MVAAVALSAAAAVAATVSLTSSIQTASALNNLSAATASALQTQEAINAHLQAGILLVNQRVDLVQEQVEILENLLTVGCIQSLPGLCVTSSAYQNLSVAANLSRELSKHLTGTWSYEFHNLMQQLCVHILAVNTTLVKVIALQAWVQGLMRGLTFTKQWAGLFCLAVLLCLGLGGLLRCILKMRADQQRQKVAIVQAMMALESGSSPHIWLSMLDR
ncbi:uncharacterized protein LOC128560103 [Nycticebus coucang]|uniref:uncharacterized protein LOC128560103 n=1 Tax=Nycticebus coucang TaxID=9470 RepID=UPI00234D9D8B|nr:uncharacterized protein LOC128560103 [Nycticebus coucang]